MTDAVEPNLDPDPAQDRSRAPEEPLGSSKTIQSRSQSHRAREAAHILVRVPADGAAAIDAAIAGKQTRQQRTPVMSLHTSQQVRRITSAAAAEVVTRDGDTSLDVAAEVAAGAVLEADLATAIIATNEIASIVDEVEVRVAVGAEAEVGAETVNHAVAVTVVIETVVNPPAAAEAEAVTEVDNEVIVTRKTVNRTSATKEIRRINVLSAVKSNLMPT